MKPTSALSVPHSDRDLYRLVRSGLLARGWTLAEWCRKEEVSAAWVRKCLSGKSNGPAARKMTAKVMNEAGISEW